MSEAADHSEVLHGDEPIQILNTMMTDPQDETGPCLLKMELWPIPQPLAKELGEVLTAFLKSELGKRGLCGGAQWIDVTAQGPT